MNEKKRREAQFNGSFQLNAMCDTDLLLFHSLFSCLLFRACFFMSLLIFSCASCFIRLVIYRLFSNFPSRSFQFSLDSCFIEINTRIYYIHDVCPFVSSDSSQTLFLDIILFVFCSCYCLAFVILKLLLLSRFFFSLIRPIIFRRSLLSCLLFVFLIVSFSCSVRCFLRRFLFKQNKHTHTQDAKWLFV